MTIHYHGTPITPVSELLGMAGKNFCISYGTSSKSQVRVCHEIGQSVMVDNGAFSLWMKGIKGSAVKGANGGLVPPDWSDYYSWAEPWAASRSTWFVIPDVIDGGSTVNDLLVKEWPVKSIPKSQAAPVWHMDEPIQRLLDLVRIGRWEKICIGSSGRFRTVGSESWHRRMDTVFNRISDPSGRVPVWLHMLRGMRMCESYYPFSSVDSTDVARNYKERGDIITCADRWDKSQCPLVWHKKMEQNGFDFFGCEVNE